MTSAVFNYQESYLPETMLKKNNEEIKLTLTGDYDPATKTILNFKHDPIPKEIGEYTHLTFVNEIKGFLDHSFHTLARLRVFTGVREVCAAHLDNMCNPYTITCDQVRRDIESRNLNRMLILTIEFWLDIEGSEDKRLKRMEIQINPHITWYEEFNQNQVW